VPTYDYLCDACNHAFEAFQSITAAPMTECPQCKKAALKRLIGAGSGPIFKGTGFYCTDYRSPGRKQDESVDRHKKAAKDVKEASSGSSGSPPATPSAPGPSAPGSTSGTNGTKT